MLTHSFGSDDEGTLAAGIELGTDAIECCIDVANHVISSENFRFPRNNADSFVVLVERGILPEDRQESLRAMARFRNRLVHLYWEVDDDRVFEFLEHSMEDLRAFSRAIADHAW